MRTYLVSYADGLVHLSNQRALLRSAAGDEFDVMMAYRREHLPEAFRSRHRHILAEKRGAGYWLWKPYVIQDCLRHADEGDLVVYMDAGILIRRPLGGLLDQADRSHLLLVRTGRPHAMYVKRDCFVLTGTDVPECHRARILDGAFLALKNTAANRHFVEMWLEHCTDPRILTDRPNECGRPNLPEFLDHRHDQAVLSVLHWREREHLPNLVVERPALRASVWHHRRRRARVPIFLWHRTPRPVRRAVFRWPSALWQTLFGRRVPSPPAGQPDPGARREG